VTEPPPAAGDLPRRVGAAGVLLLTLSATTPASSLFVIVPGAMQVAGTGALWAFLIAGLVCLGSAFVYAELSSAFPEAGGEWTMVARTLGPGAGFAVLVVNLFNNILFPPVVALGVAEVLAGVVPGLPPVAVAVSVLAGATALALADLGVNARVTGLFLALEAAALVLVAALASPVRSLAGLLAHPVAASGTALVPAGAGAIGVAATVAVFALNGYGMAVYFGEEMRDAARRIGRVVLLSFAAGFACQLVPLALVLLSARDLPALFGAADPFGSFVAARGGAALAGAAAVGVAIAIVNAAIVTLLASARFLYATARDGTWGGAADRVLARVTNGVPRAATLAVGVAGAACCLLPLRLLLVLNGAGLVAIYLAISAGAIAGRVRGTTRHAPYRMPLFPLAPAAVIVALAGIVAVSWADPVEGRPGIIATVAQVVGAVAFYLWRRRAGPLLHHASRVALPRSGEDVRD